MRTFAPAVMAVLYGATVLAQNESAHVNDGAFTRENVQGELT